MNTTEKGNAFERKALKIINQAIENGELGLSKKAIRVFSKKGYFSFERQGQIVFDISIEVWPKGAENYTLLYLIECKDYKGKVPVSDIEEFSSKVKQVTGLNTKAVFITNSELQDSAYNFAKSNKMMLIKASSRSYDYLLHKTKRKNESSLTDKTKSNFNSDEEIIDKILNEILDTDFESDNIHNVSILSKEQIELFTEQILNKIDPNILAKGFTLTTTKLLKYLKEELCVTVDLLPRESNLLGSCSILKNTISIHPTLINTKRYSFVLAHETGHFILHKNLKIDQQTYENFDDSELNFKTGHYELNNPKNWIEWQANYFASILILHKITFTARLLWYQQHNRTKEGIVYLDDQYENIANFNLLLEQLSYHFEATKTSIHYRLQELQLINNKSRLRHISKIIPDWIENSII